MRVNREHLLQVLESVGVGVAKRASFHQSTCLVFDKGKVVTYNGVIACMADSPLNGVRGAVPAQSLMDYLRSLTEEELDVDSEASVLRVKAKGKRIKIAMEADILLPVDQIDPPTEWLDLDPDFCDALNVVADCASKDESTGASCVHVAKKWVEAMDGGQMMRYRVKTGVAEPFLIDKSAAKQACVMGMTKWSVAERCVHFTNGDGYVMSVAKNGVDDFYDLSHCFSVEGEPVNLPKGLAKIAAQAELASKESRDDNVVAVTLRPGEIVVKAQGLVTEYESRSKINYSGPEFQFCLPPSLLAILADKYNEARVGPTRLVVDGGKWRYAVMLKLPEK